MMKRRREERGERREERGEKGERREALHSKLACLKLKLLMFIEMTTNFGRFVCNNQRVVGGLL